MSVVACGEGARANSGECNFGAGLGYFYQGVSKLSRAQGFNFPRRLSSSSIPYANETVIPSRCQELHHPPTNPPPSLRTSSLPWRRPSPPRTSTRSSLSSSLQLTGGICSCAISFPSPLPWDHLLTYGGGECCAQCIDKSDFNTLETPQIAGHLEKYGVPQLQKITVTDPQKAVFDPAANWLQAFFSFEMTLTRGTGLLRLQESAPGQGDWKAFTLFVS